MLSHIHIRNFAIVDEVDVEFDAGMTALTGETGAGKSILVDALGLVLGDRAEGGVIRHGCDRAEISAGFDIGGNAAATSWLAERELDMDGECQLRRVISRGGRTRGYINGQPSPMQSLRELGEMLVDIHGQHEHQSLLRSGVQRQLLDDFGGHHALLSKVAGLYGEWQAAREELDALIRNDTERDARLDLLRYQLQELEALGMTVDDIRSIDEEHSRLANAGQLLETCQQGLARLDADDGNAACSLINRTLEELAEVAALDSRLEDSTRLLNEASILVQECIDSLRQYADRLELDPERLHWLEERIGVLHDLARKHRCPAEELPAVQASMRRELDSIEHADQHREALQARLNELETRYTDAARRLSGKRSKAAVNLGRAISGAMQTLGMAGGVFEAAVVPRSDRAFSAHGADSVEFRVTANRGQPVQPLARVASGGELSRISLSIQVISAGSDTTPTMIFDEVDSGIGGSVAEIVGQKLRALGTERQILCVTHLPQVAALAHHQLQVSKLAGEDTTRTRIRALDDAERMDEIARMLGGVKITRQTREHAREMLGQAQAAGKPGRKKTRTKRA